MLDDKLDLFMQAYDAPNFSAAAARVPMTPQGFTKAIKKLESDLGVPLFEFDEHGTRRPTPYADELYAYAKHAKTERKALDETFARIRNAERVNLKVACAVGVPGLFGVDTIQGFSEVDQRVVVSFTELPDSLCDSLVVDETYEVGLTLSPVRGELSAVPLFTTPVLIWVRADDPLSEQRKLSLADLSGRHLAMPGKEFRCYQNLQDAYQREGVEPPKITEYAEIFWIYSYVISGRGLGFCLPHLAALDMFDDRDKVVALPLDGLTWQVCFAWPRARELTGIERDYLAYLRKRLKKRRSQQ